VDLGYRNRTDLADSLQFTVRTLTDIEHGVRKASPETYAVLENKLAWAPDSIDTILAGGEPNETVVQAAPHPHNPLAHTATEAPSRASTEELLLELRRRIIALATDALRAGTAWTRTATGPKRASEASALGARHCPAT